jgi:hypothetical protein
VSIDTTSYSDPAFLAKPYSKICVYSVDQDLSKRGLIEEIFVDELTDAGVLATQGSMMFPPTREWSEADFQSQLTKYGFDGFLKIEIVSEDVNERVTPHYRTETRTREYETEDGDRVTRTETNAYVSNSVDVFVKNQFQADLIDVATNKIAWKGYSKTSAQTTTIGVNRGTILGTFAQSIVEELQYKKHIIEKE